MKPPVELNILDIVDRLDALSRRAAAMAVAMIGLNDSPAPLAISGLCDLAWDMSEEASTLSGLLHQAPKVRKHVDTEKRVEPAVAAVTELTDEHKRP